MEKGKKIAILQSNYLPLKGYFDILNLVDEFVLFADAQYTKNDWRDLSQELAPVYHPNVRGHQTSALNIAGMNSSTRLTTLALEI